ncbi:flavodoxin [Bacteroides hominis]|uniref:flavodoxin n=1 Tax=Bacteroides hominis TaxID=2763023 RepID=UPI003D6C0E53
MRTKLLCLLLSVIGLCGCNSTNAQKQPQTSNVKSGKSLVVFFSWGGNTRAVAEKIGQLTGADEFELQLAVPYTTDRDEIEEVAKREVRDKHTPKLASLPPNMEQYDVIYIGSPCWFNTFAPPVRTFLSTVDLSGKKVVPFMTHGGSRMGQSVQEIRNLAPKADVTEGLAIRESNATNAEKEISAWLKKNNLTK